MIEEGNPTPDFERKLYLPTIIKPGQKRHTNNWGTRILCMTLLNKNVDFCSSLKLSPISYLKSTVISDFHRFVKFNQHTEHLLSRFMDFKPINVYLGLVIKFEVQNCTRLNICWKFLNSVRSSGVRWLKSNEDTYKKSQWEQEKTETVKEVRLTFTISLK